MLAVLGACVVVVAGIVAGLAATGSGGQRPPRTVVAGSGGASPAGRLSATATRSAAARRDPFATAAAYLSGRTGTVVAAVYDVATGRTWRVGSVQPQAAASVVKLDVLETLLAERSPTDGIGLSASGRSLAEQMIEGSDNAAATTLWDEAGGSSGLRSFNAQAGLTHTVPSSCVVCAGFIWPGWGLTTTTPDDQITLLKQLVMPGSLLTSAERAYALSLLKDVTPSQRWGVSGGAPAHVTVALKDGWLPLQGTDDDWQVNSVGWVSGDGRDYLMAVLTTGNPTERYGIDTIERLAATTWQAMG